MVSALGAEPMFVDAHEHDSFVGGISHLPFLLSIALMRTVSADPGWRDMKFLTAGGFRDVSRLAAGSPEMHRDITATNRESVTRWVDMCIDELQHVRSLIAANSDEADETLLARFREARDARADWATAERREGQLVQDTEGELSKASVSEQMSQMFVGGMFRRKPRMTGSNRDRPGRDRD
jgi:prephenate dehydrogenase